MADVQSENRSGNGAARKSSGRDVDKSHAGGQAGASMSNRIIGSLKDALLAAGRDEPPAKPVAPSIMPLPPPLSQAAPATPQDGRTSGQDAGHDRARATAVDAEVVTPSAEEAARIARGDATPKRIESPKAAAAPETPFDGPPTTRVMRPDAVKKAAKQTIDVADAAERTARTVLVRGKQAIDRSAFERDPVVGFLIVVGGPGLGAFRPVFEGNNTIGRATSNRIPLDFGDETISSEQQAYIRYDSSDRSFLFVPNLAKTNVVSVNNQKPTSALPLAAMDVLTFGRTQVAFLPFCGDDFDWAEIADA